MPFRAGNVWGVQSTHGYENERVSSAHIDSSRSLPIARRDSRCAGSGLDSAAAITGDWGLSLITSSPSTRRRSDIKVWQVRRWQGDRPGSGRLDWPAPVGGHRAFATRRASVCPDASRVGEAVQDSAPPTWSTRCQPCCTPSRRLGDEAQRPAGDKEKRLLGERQQCEKMRKKSKDILSQSRLPQLVAHLSQRTHHLREIVLGHRLPMRFFVRKTSQPLSRTAKKVARAAGNPGVARCLTVLLFVEVFSGCGRLARQFAMRGFRAVLWDVADGAKYDLLSTHTRLPLKR